jgi:glycosyltransferase involved in cell wall biosynthesis
MTKILLVAMVDSIHVARWLAQFEPEKYEFVVFPSAPNRRIHPLIRKMMLENGNIRIVPAKSLFSIPLWGLDLILDNRVRAHLLRHYIRSENPDFVHALELQHAGYIVSRALKDESLKTEFIATNYGSDIFWFQKFPKHLAKIKSLLKRADRYSAECNRDVALAKQYGFSGKVLPVFPNAGGFTGAQLANPMQPSGQRNTILIKGYEGWVGRASVAIEALDLLKTELSSYRIVFYSCNAKTIRLLRRAKRRTNLNIEWHAKGKLPHAKMLELFSTARLYVGLSLSDGISTSLLEAMAMGAFPIQTSTACVDDWFTSGQTGISVELINPVEVAAAITDALGKSNDGWADINRATIAKQASFDSVKALAQTFYEVA